MACRLVAVLLDTYPYNGSPSNSLLAGNPAFVHWFNAAWALACGCCELPHPSESGALGPSNDATLAS